MLPNQNEVEAVEGLLPIPDMRAWWQITNPFGQYLWMVKPPGEWMTVMRFDEWLVSSSPAVPLDVEWEKVFTMLKRHQATLLGRLSGAGIIAIAVAGPDSPWLPLTPGYRMVVADPLSVLGATEDDLRSVSEDRMDWPAGLLEPSIIHMQSAHSLKQREHRESWLAQYPEGMWLVSVQDGRFRVFEVLN
jgi:hypothetical protein